jgi:acetolactate synthase-1/2/3 large subunit
VVNTFLGLGSFPRSHVLSFGMLGMHGTACANLAVDAADLIIAIGMRFDDRATAKVSGFAPHAQVIHIDIDPAEIGKNIRVDVPIVGDVAQVLEALNKQVTSQSRVEWISQIEEWQREHPSTLIRSTESVLPQYVIQQIYEITGGNAIIVTGVGQHQMWSAHYFQYERPNTLISSGGLGPMGFELPAAVGAKVACPEETVWCIAGDGGFQMTIQELATVSQENLAVKIAIINNRFLGMVRQWQQLFYQRRYVATPLSGPDFVKVAEAYGIAALKVTDRLQVIPAIEQAMEHQGPFLIDFMVDPEENVYPMVPPGAALAEILEEQREEVRAR